MREFKFTVTVQFHDYQHAGDDGISEVNLTGETVGRMLKHHIQTAVKHWGGQCHPNHVLFPTNLKSVKVKREK